MPQESYYKTVHWQNLRSLILRRDGYRCRRCNQLCLGKRRNGISPVVDHVKPRPIGVKGPTDADIPANLVTLCHPCHSRKTTYEDKNERGQIGADGMPKDGTWS